MLFAATRLVLVPRQLLILCYQRQPGGRLAPLIDTGVGAASLRPRCTSARRTEHCLMGGVAGGGWTPWTLCVRWRSILFFFLTTLVCSIHTAESDAFLTAATGCS